MCGNNKSSRARNDSNIRRHEEVEVVELCGTGFSALCSAALTDRRMQTGRCESKSLKSLKSLEVNPDAEQMQMHAGSEGW